MYGLTLYKPFSHETGSFGLGDRERGLFCTVLYNSRLVQIRPKKGKRLHPN